MHSGHYSFVKGKGIGATCFCHVHFPVCTHREGYSLVITVPVLIFAHEGKIRYRGMCISCLSIILNQRVLKNFLVRYMMSNFYIFILYTLWWWSNSLLYHISEHIELGSIAEKATSHSELLGLSQEPDALTDIWWNGFSVGLREP